MQGKNLSHSLSGRVLNLQGKKEMELPRTKGLGDDYSTTGPNFIRWWGRGEGGIAANRRQRRKRTFRFSVLGAVLYFPTVSTLGKRSGEQIPHRKKSPEGHADPGHSQEFMKAFDVTPHKGKDTERGVGPRNLHTESQALASRTNRLHSRESVSDIVSRIWSLVLVHGLKVGASTPLDTGGRFRLVRSSAC